MIFLLGCRAFDDAEVLELAYCECKHMTKGKGEESQHPLVRSLDRRHRLCRGLQDKLFLIGKGERASATREGGSQWSKGRAFRNNLNGAFEGLSF